MAKLKKAQLGSLLAKAAGRAAERGSIRAAEETAAKLGRAEAIRAAEREGYVATRKIDRYDRKMVTKKPEKKIYDAAERYRIEQAKPKPSSQELVKRDFPNAPAQVDKETKWDSRGREIKTNMTPHEIKRQKLIDSRLFSDKVIKAPSSLRKAKGPVKMSELDDLKKGGKVKKAKSGGMLKRADGSYSKRGLWDNIRANRGSGKKPTAAMLKQERKIKAKTKK